MHLVKIDVTSNPFLSHFPRLYREIQKLNKIELDEAHRSLIHLIIGYQTMLIQKRVTSISISDDFIAHAIASYPIKPRDNHIDILSFQIMPYRII